MSDHQDPTWALLSQASAKTLQRLIDQGPPGAKWRVVRGTGKVNALVDDEPGTEHSGERELAEALSRKARCYVVYFDPPWVSTCEQGRWIDESGADPFELARSLGCPLTAEPASFEAPPLSALVVQGATPQVLAQALDWPWPLPGGDARKALAVPLGAAAWDEGGDLVDYALRVARRLGLPMYTVECRADKVLRCEFIDNAEVVGAFDHPATWWVENPKRMPDVLGQTEPEAILGALGLPVIGRGTTGSG